MSQALRSYWLPDTLGVTCTNSSIAVILGPPTTKKTEPLGTLFAQADLHHRRMHSPRLLCRHAHCHCRLRLARPNHHMKFPLMLCQSRFCRQGPKSYVPLMLCQSHLCRRLQQIVPRQSLTPKSLWSRIQQYPRILPRQELPPTKRLWSRIQQYPRMIPRQELPPKKRLCCRLQQYPRSPQLHLHRRNFRRLRRRKLCQSGRRRKLGSHRWNLTPKE